MDTETIQGWAKEGRLYRFYKSPEWLELRAEIMAENHGECLWCRQEGRMQRAETVHHVQHVRTHPELALSRTYTDADGTEQPNLIPLCHACHDRAHGRMQFKPKPEPLTEERW